MNFITLTVTQMLVAFYHMTSLKVGNVDLAQISLNIQDWVLSSETVFVLKIIALAITVVMSVIAVILFNKTHEMNHTLAVLQSPAPSEPAEGGPLQNRWEEIMRHVDSIREAEWKFAIIEADKLVDDQLKNHFPGETMGERLMNIDKTKLLSIDGLWEAHKVRNRLAHDMNYFLRHAEALRAIRLYEQTLKELEVIK